MTRQQTVAGITVGGNPLSKFEITIGRPSGAKLQADRLKARAVFLRGLFKDTPAPTVSRQLARARYRRARKDELSRLKAEGHRYRQPVRYHPRDDEAVAAARRMAEAKAQLL